jgi:hypothetical protein
MATIVRSSNDGRLESADAVRRRRERGWERRFAGVHRAPPGSRSSRTRRLSPVFEFVASSSLLLLYSPSFTSRDLTSPVRNLRAQKSSTATLSHINQQNTNRNTKKPTNNSIGPNQEYHPAAAPAAPASQPRQPASANRMRDRQTENIHIALSASFDQPNLVVHATGSAAAAAESESE